MTNELKSGDDDRLKAERAEREGRRKQRLLEDARWLAKLDKRREEEAKVVEQRLQEKRVQQQVEFESNRQTANRRVLLKYAEVMDSHTHYALALHRLKTASMRVDEFGDPYDDKWSENLTAFIQRKVVPLADLTESESLALNVDFVADRIEQDLEDRWGVLSTPASDQPSRKGRVLEEVCANTLKAGGYAVANIGAAGDQGADLLVQDVFGNLFVVQCKNLDGPVGNRAVQEVHAARGHYRASGALVVSGSSAFTPAARTLARSLSVVLAGPEQLCEFLRTLSVPKPS